MKSGKHPGPTQHSPTISPLVQIGLFVVVLLMAWYFVFLRYQLNTEFPLATLKGLVDGEAYKPFQYRMLVPWLAGGLASTGLLSLLNAYEFLDFISVVGIFYAFRYLLASYLDGRELEVGSFLIFYALVWNFLLPRDLPLILPYDLSGIAFFTLGLALLNRHRWTWYYPVYVIACFNKESMGFLVLLLVVVEFGRMAQRTLGLHTAAMLGIWLAVKFIMAALYPNNPGNVLELHHVNSDVLHITTNFELLSKARHVLLILSNAGFAWLIVLFGYARIPGRFARRALWIIPPFVLMKFAFGNINEVRGLGELLPVVMLGLALLIFGTQGTAKRATS